MHLEPLFSLKESGSFAISGMVALRAQQAEVLVHNDRDLWLESEDLLLVGANPRHTFVVLDPAVRNNAPVGHFHGAQEQRGVG